MEILIGLGLAVWLLYGWLRGHWFARVLATIIFAPIFAFALACAVAALIPSTSPTAPAFFLVFLAMGIGAGAGWFAAGLPIYCRRGMFTGQVARKPPLPCLGG